MLITCDLRVHLNNGENMVKLPWVPIQKTFLKRCQFLKGYSDQVFSSEEEKENMAVLENRDLGQIMSSLLETSDTIASVGHISGRVAMLKCQASNQHFSCWLCQGHTRVPTVGTLTLLLGVYNSLPALKEVCSSGGEVPHSTGAFQKPFSPGAERDICQLALWLLAGQAVAGLLLSESKSQQEKEKT